jgi:hypothetical protein
LIKGIFHPRVIDALRCMLVDFVYFLYRHFAPVLLVFRATTQQIVCKFTNKCHSERIFSWIYADYRKISVFLPSNLLTYI